jgi:hypothetical protein
VTEIFTFKEQKEILDYQTTTLWFTVKEMQRDKLLQVRLKGLSHEIDLKNF